MTISLLSYFLPNCAWAMSTPFMRERTNVPPPEIALTSNKPQKDYKWVKRP